MAQLSPEEVSRYGRQLILPEWGRRGQEALKGSSVLVVGVGGLGCPCSLYLAAAGVGRLGLLDYDRVELGNLHRQVLHCESKVGVAKAESGRDAVGQLNSHVTVTTHTLLLDSSNALPILSQYDVIVDATDNVATRYLLNDGCVLLGKPLVSGSALRFEGQLTVYNWRGGPCYRCLFPSPPPPTTVTSCSEGGVLGVVPGVIGSLQALEALKIASGLEPLYSQQLLLFEALSGGFRTVKLRPRQPQCAVCGDNPSITALIDYELFCGSRADDKERNVDVLGPELRISPQEYREVVRGGKLHLLLDVREEVEYQICHLPHSKNIPLRLLQTGSLDTAWQWIIGATPTNSHHDPVFVVCRRGNDSQLAVQLLYEHKKAKVHSAEVTIRDIVGGLVGWSDSVDPLFPKY